MKHYEIKTFTIPKLVGISEKNVEEHLKLYAGYVKHVNLISDHIKELKSDAGKYAYELGEINRRFSFEWNGMRNHEYYFSSFEDGYKEINTESNLYKKICESWGSFDLWINEFKSIAKTRGVGWAILYFDKENNQLINTWVDEQHLGHLNSCQYIFGIDVWEHAYVIDYTSSGKTTYIDDYFKNINWEKSEKLFDSSFK
jgi:superoxide dismutase, Fe-Mn family